MGIYLFTYSIVRFVKCCSIVNVFVHVIFDLINVLFLRRKLCQITMNMKSMKKVIF